MVKVSARGADEVSSRSATCDYTQPVAAPSSLTPPAVAAMGRAMRALALVLAAFVASCGPFVGGLIDRVREAPAPAVSERAATLHRQAPVVDLHADPLLWGRNLLARSTTGHVDVPRLREGGVALQVFGIVTKFPIVPSIERTNPRWPDAVTLLALASLWPLRTVGNIEARMLYQAGELHRMAAASNGTLAVIETRADLERLLARRAGGADVVGGLLDIEGAHCLGDDPANLAHAFDAGVRMIGLAHFYDTAFGGSAHGVGKIGLTDRGRTLVHDMERRGVVVDLAHSSAATIADVLAIATRPVVVSHTGLRATCDNQRNLSDDQLRGVAQNGGVVGIGFWDTAVCGVAAADIARAIKYAVDLIGDDHVGLGSDFDGAVTTGFDTSRMRLVTQAMLDAGIPDTSIPKILGGNAVRVFREVLPR